MLLTIIIPCFNEEKTIQEIINRIYSLEDLSKDVIVVDDGSYDNTKNLLFDLKKQFNFQLITHEFNQGKGAAIITAQKFIKGDIVIIQDADLEYDPKDYYQLIKPIKLKEFQVVYGSRILHKNIFENINNFSHWFRVIGNLILTKISNIINCQNLTDAHTCYKVFDSNLFKSLDLKEKNFNFCPEITTKIRNKYS